MTTLEEMIEIIKSENPTLRIGDEEFGYVELSDGEYNAKITEWATARLEKETRLQAIEQNRLLKISAYEKLGLTPDEIAVLVPVSKSVQ